MAITPLPAAPSRAVPSTFSTLADAFLAALSTFVTEANALETNVNAKEVIVTAQASAAATAMASANFKGLWSALSGALAVPASVSHLGRYWMLLSNLANVAAKTPGTDSEWQEIGNVTIQDFQAAVNPRAMSQGVAMTAAASGSSGIQVADNDNINFGTGNFTLVWKGSLPDWTPSTAPILIGKFNGGDGYALLVSTTGQIQLIAYDTGVGTGNLYTASVIPTITDGTVQEIAVSFAVGAVNATADFYVNGVALGVQQSAAKFGSLNTDVALSILGIGYDTVRYAGTVHHAYTFNRALTAAEVLDLYRNGIAEADKWGSQTAFYENDAWTGASGATPPTGWTNYAGRTANYDIYDDTAGGGDTTTLKMTQKDAATSIYPFMYKSFTVTPYKNYQLKIKARNVDAASYSIFVGQTEGNGFYYNSDAIVSTSWVTYTTTFTPVDSSIAVSLNITASVNDQYALFDEIELKEIGATLCLQPEGIQPAPGMWLDSSTNNLHAIYPAAGASITRPKDSFVIRWVNTWAGTHEAQYIGGINQAILPPKCCITSIMGVVAGTTIEDIILGDGSDTDHWVATTTGLAAGTQVFTVANAFSDGTNYKMVVDPDANFSGSITWTIRGYIYQ